MADDSSHVTDAPQTAKQKQPLKIGIAIALISGLFVMGAIGLWAWLSSPPSSPVTANGSSPAAPPASSLSSNSQEDVNPINQKVMIEQWEVTILRIDMEGGVLGEHPLEKRALGQWVLVSLDAKNLGNQTDALSARYFNLADSQGRMYEVSSEGSYEMAARGNSNYVYDDVPPDVSSHIVLAFDVAPGANDFTLVVRTGEGIENIALYDRAEAGVDSDARETEITPNGNSDETAIASTPPLASTSAENINSTIESSTYVLETEDFRITLMDHCVNRQEPCDRVFYHGLNLSNEDALTLNNGVLVNACQGTQFPCSGARYEFRNGNYRYVVTGEGYLQVYQGEERLLNAAGQWESASSGVQRIVRTDAGYVNLRSAPTAESEVLGRVSDGTSVRVLDEVSNASGYVWYQVESNGNVGWIYSELLN